MEVQPLDKAEIASAYQALLDGTEGAKDRLALACQPLVSIAAKQFSKGRTYSPERFEDLESAARVAQYEAIGLLVTALTAGKKNPVYGAFQTWISTVMKNAMTRCCIEDTLIGPGADQVIKNKGKKPTTTIYTGPLIEEITPEDGIDRDADPENYQSVVDLEVAANSTLDLIYRCCESERDRQIVELRRLGNSDAEVAAVLGCDRSTVFRARQRIEAKYNEATMALAI